MRSSPEMPPQAADRIIDRRRYRQVRRFILGIAVQTLLWDGLFALPLLRWIRPDPVRRWQAAAARYRELATRMGGILIKLGQFLSTRVDLFPVEVTAELANLQDEVPAAPCSDIITVIEADFGRPLQEIFTEIDETPVGSASLAQAHRASLPDGDQVVVKVLRPDIHVIVETDLEAIGLLCRWLKIMKHVRERMDLDRLLEEFAATTRDELDMRLEAANLDRFAADFQDDPNVLVPRVYKEFSSQCTLTLENVGYLKIGDVEMIRDCGISPGLVADRLYDVYMHQIFKSNFIHADPHPGNIFVKPLPTPDEERRGQREFLPGDPVPHVDTRPFQLVFIDFGMMAAVSDRLRTAMRMAIIGIGTQDAFKVVQAFVMSGMLRRGADLRHLERAHQEWLQKIWGLRMGKMSETAIREVRTFMREYRDLILETPFQIQAEMLFIGRAIGILAGLTTRIDPEFDPWTKAFFYAKEFAKEEMTEEWQGVWEEALMLGKNLSRIPAHMEQVLTRAKQGALAVQVSLSPETRKSIRRIDRSVKQFAWMVITAALLISGVIVGRDDLFGASMIGLSVLSFLWGMRRS